MLRPLCFSLFLSVFNLQEDKAADNKGDQYNCYDCFSVHYSSSSFFFFLSATKAVPAMPRAESPASTVHKPTLLLSPVLGVSLRTLCISTTVVEPTFTLAFLSAGKTYPAETLSPTSDTVYSPIRSPSIKISPFLSVVKLRS